MTEHGYFVEVAENGPWLTQNGAITDKWEARGIWKTAEEAEQAIKESLTVPANQHTKAL